MSTSAICRLLLLLLLFSPLSVACNDDEAGENDTATEVDVDVDATDGAGSGEFISNEGAFRVTFPNGATAPQEQVVPVPTEIGNIDMHMFLVDAGTEAYMAAWADYPDTLIAASEPQTMLDMGRDGAIANVNGELLKENDFKLQGYPAKEFFARGEQAGQDVYMRAVIVMAGGRLYQVLYLAFAEDEIDSDKAATYVTSFQIDEVAEISN